MQREYSCHIQPVAIFLQKIRVATQAINGIHQVILFKSMTYSAASSENTPHEFFEVVNAALAVNSPEQFTAWAQNELQRVFPHGMLACGIGMIEDSGGHIEQVVTSNFPYEYLQGLQQVGGLGGSPIVSQWARTRMPVLFELSDLSPPSVWLENFRKHGLRNIAAHGLSDLNSCATSYFSFFQIPGKLSDVHVRLLELLVPHLHLALVRALKGVQSELTSAKSVLYNLTDREREILHWLGSGKTNWEIAQVLKISENTVKNHVQRILSKLKVSTRAQAVAKGVIQNFKFT